MLSFFKKSSRARKTVILTIATIVCFLAFMAQQFENGTSEGKVYNHFSIFQTLNPVAHDEQKRSKIQVHKLVVKNHYDGRVILQDNNSAETSIVTSHEKARQLNERGVAFVLEKNYWEGLYLFDQAIQLDPSQIIPVINMAVTLTEMGLTQPANNYFEIAQTIDPAHPWLLKLYPDYHSTENDESIVRISPSAKKKLYDNKL